MAETVAIMEREGLEKATMRRVAHALDTGPASLYVYVANTAELHAAVLDSLVRTLVLQTDGDWRTRLFDLLSGYRALLHSHRGLARSAIVLRPSGPNFVVLYDRILGLLIEGGVEVSRAAWGVDLLLQHITAGAAEHSEPGEASEGMDEFRRLLRKADPVTSPHVAQYADELVGGTPETRTTWGLSAVLDGITRTPVPTGSRDHLAASIIEGKS